ncbi:MAG: DUF192 domain-containing protein [Deltaproteobacteria bacterium]|nr:DUF192 domain-containing protein [Deltaproteobacteria bacterium]
MFRPRRPLQILALVAAAVAVALAAHAVDLNTGLPVATMKIGAKTLTVEVAITGEQQRVGLMNRKEMADDHGMIFIYAKPKRVRFWMKNTYIPLSTAFVAEDGTIVKIADMEPLTETHHEPDVPVRYVIEANRGWFAGAGARVGDRIDVSAFAGR